MCALALFNLYLIYLVGMASQGVVHVHCFHKCAQNVHFGAMYVAFFSRCAHAHINAPQQNVHKMCILEQFLAISSAARADKPFTCAPHHEDHSHSTVTCMHHRSLPDRISFKLHLFSLLVYLILIDNYVLGAA